MKTDSLNSPPDHAFSLPEQQAVYRAIRERRDMRHFSSGSVPDVQLQRLLSAAHHAPSVGFMQRGASSAFAAGRYVKACMRWSSRSGC